MRKLECGQSIQFSELDKSTASGDIKMMAETKEQRVKRMAEALRENLKRRKSQQRDIGADASEGDQRLFREKPIKPQKK